MICEETEAVDVKDMPPLKVGIFVQQKSRIVIMFKHCCAQMFTSVTGHSLNEHDVHGTSTRFNRWLKRRGSPIRIHKSVKGPSGKEYRHFAYRVDAMLSPEVVNLFREFCESERIKDMIFSKGAKGQAMTEMQARGLIQQDDRIVMTQSPYEPGPGQPNIPFPFAVAPVDNLLVPQSPWNGHEVDKSLFNESWTATDNLSLFDMSTSAKK